MSARGFGSTGIAAATGGSIASPPVTSLVNYWRIIGSATGSPVQAIVDTGSADTNVGAVFGPKGTGAISAQVPDSASTGGNARGANAVDWQTLRLSANQVAAGASATIGGGQNNLANSANATVAGGSGNTANAADAVVAGGNSNASSAARGAVGGGQGNTASGTSSVVAGGFGGVASGASSWIPGGNYSTTRGMYGRGAWASGRIAATGDAQAGEHMLLRQTTDATPTRLTADNAAAATVNTINLPNFSTYTGTLLVTAKAAGATDAATWRLSVSAVRGNGVGTVVVYEGAAAAIVPTASNGTGSAWRLDIAADTTNGGIAITGTGALATTINWLARFMNVETVTAS